MKNRGIGIVLAIVAFSTVSGVMAPGARAAGFVVSNTADSGPGSLHQAILDANAAAGADLITFDASTNTLPIVDIDLPRITDSVTIQGNGVGQTIIEPGYADPGKFYIDATTGSFVVSDLTVQAGLVLVESTGVATVEFTRIDAVNNTEIELIARDGSLSAVLTESRIEQSFRNALTVRGLGASLTVERSLIANIDGAAVTAADDATLTMRNSTVTGISDGADGIRVGGPTTLVNVTISAIEDYAIISYSESPDISVSLTNTIIRDARTASCVGSLVITSGGGNITDDATCGLTQPSDLQNTEALLGALADNGGRTRTLLPQAGSPAIDGGVATGCPAIDQRGLARPADGNGDAIAVCDSGAVEVGAVQATTTTTTTTTTAAPTVTEPGAAAPVATVAPTVAPTNPLVTLLPETGTGTNIGIGLIAAGLVGLGSLLVLAVARRRPVS